MPVLPALGGLLALYLAAPFVAGLAHIGLADWRGADWPGLGQATLVSVLSATAATLLIALGGIPLGYLLARRPARAMRLLGFMVQLPLALPPLSSGILLLFLLGYASPIGILTHGALTDSFAGIVLAETFVAAPFLIIAARSAFAEVDPVLEDVARTLGHAPGSVFMRVSLPLAARGIAAGLLLAWLRAFGEFGATVMVAYHPYSLPVYTYVAFGGEGLPAMVPVLLPTLGAALLIMFFATRLTTPRRSRLRPAEAASGMLPPVPSPAGDQPPKAFAFTLTRKLDGFSLDVSYQTTARRIAILGPSGSGKSLTLRALAGLDAQAGDRLTIGDQDWAKAPAEARRVAYVPQSYGLFPHLTAEKQLAFARDADMAVARQWFEKLGLCELEQRYPAALSLGQQQRVALARALGRPADLLLLDEPFSALDTPRRAELRAALRALQAQITATSILVTHDPADAFALADDIIIVDQGQVLQAGPVNDVFLRPRSALVAHLLGAEATAKGIVAAPNAIDIGNDVTLPISGPALRPGDRIGWTIAAERIRIVPSGELPAEIIAIEPAQAGRRRVIIRVGHAELPVVQAPDEGLCPGPIRVTLPPGAIQVWNEDETMALR
ncbi:ABC transporter ATP-binding protein/permease [Acidisoma silvae]|uniref:ATP-binding cassette domain-containing protein n=1 Tax=Acidisoma silvae TaxID=2802396 RepID=A0A964DYX6_9PROT|nr:ATP-binding cassette domain-containing protein [Acidisoma silvae]MCB8875208.1 ATP-binding cassette domain-containing protein [Acidisoma silvae]